MSKTVSTLNAPRAIGPYSQGVISSGHPLLFLAGQIPLDPHTMQVVGHDIVTQTHQVLKNMGGVLKECGLDYKNVLKVTVFLKDFNDFSSMNEVYGHYFSTHLPARSAVEVSRLPKDVLIEIEAVAEMVLP